MLKDMAEMLFGERSVPGAIAGKISGVWQSQVFPAAGSTNGFAPSALF